MFKKVLSKGQLRCLKEKKHQYTLIHLGKTAGFCCTRCKHVTFFELGKGIEHTEWPEVTLSDFKTEEYRL